MLINVYVIKFLLVSPLYTWYHLYYIREKPP